MAGNVYEWNDSIPAGPFRGPMVGGAYDNIAGWLTPTNAYVALPTTEREQVGFRVVLVPEPSVASLLALGALLGRRRRRGPRWMRATHDRRATTLGVTG
jgi:hypothetical protein